MVSPFVEPFNEVKYKALMGGLECREVNYSKVFSNKDSRIDSAFYTTKIYRNPSIEYVPIGNYLISTQYGISIDMNENGVGYPIYRMNEIHNMLCDLDVSKFANLSYEEFEKFRLNDRDVVFNRTNSYEWVGRTGIYYKTGVEQTYASYLVRLVPDKSIIFPEYLVAFLNCRYGVKDIKRRARQSINQTNVNPEEVKEILIPLLGMDLQRGIESCFVKADQKRKKAKEMYAQAEQVLLSEFATGDFLITNETVSIKAISDSFFSTGRLDAEYYQPKYDKYFNILEQFKTTTITTEFDIFKNSGTEYADGISNIGVIKTKQLTNEGINYARVESYLTNDICEKNKSTFLEVGDVVLASMGVGSLGKVSLFTYQGSKRFVTDSTLRIYRQKPSACIYPEVLSLFLQSKVGQELIYRYVVGSTGIINIYDADIAKIPIPIFDESIQIEIASKVQESFALRCQSEQFLEYAKQAVEIAIEEGEDNAMKFIAELDLK